MNAHFEELNVEITQKYNNIMLTMKLIKQENKKAKLEIQ